MSYIVKRKIGNNFYAYEVSSVWDKKKKFPVQKVIRYLGPVDENGKIREKKRKPLKVLDYGDVVVAKKILDKTLLPSVIKALPFHDEEKQLIEVMLLNRVVMPQPDHLLKDWFEGNYLSKIYDISLDSRRISHLLKRIGRKDINEIYFDVVRDIVKIKDMVAYDITSIPTSVDLILSEWGRCGNGRSKIIKLAIFFDVKSRIPIHFRTITGNVQDVSTLTDMVEKMRLCLDGKTRFCAVLDRGFYSKSNIDLLKTLTIDFIIPVPRSTSLFYEMVEKNKDILKKKNQFLLNGKYNYGIKLKEQEHFIYIFYSPQKFLHDVESANRRSELDGNDKNLDKKLMIAGYTVILSTLDKDPEEILKRYYQRYYLEKSYCFLKSRVNMLPIRHHTEETSLAHIFISTLSLSLYWILHEKLKSRYSLQHAFLILRRIKAKIYDENKVFLTEIGKKEKEILRMFEISLDLVYKKCGN